VRNTRGDLHGCPPGLPAPQGVGMTVQKSAEGIVGRETEGLND